MPRSIDRHRARHYDEAAHRIDGAGTIREAQRRLLDAAAELRGDPPETVVDMAEQQRLGTQRAAVRRNLRLTGQSLAAARRVSQEKGHRDPERKLYLHNARDWLAQVALRARELGLSDRQIAAEAHIGRDTLATLIKAHTQRQEEAS